MDTGAIGRSDGTFVLTKKLSDIEIPDSLQAVIAARIDHLEETLKHVLQVASVIGREFAFRVLRVILKMKEELRQHLANLQGLEFIYEKTLFPELEYIFRHAMTQEVAYNNLLAQRRKEFHKLAGEAMEKLYAETLQEHLGPLAFHFYRAEAWEKAFKYLTAAGERARFAYATREAIDYFDKAIEVSERIPEVVDRKQVMNQYDNRGRVWAVLNEFEKAVPDFERVVEFANELGDKGKEWRTLMRLANCHALAGGLAEREKRDVYFNKALSIIKETGDATGEVRWLIDVGSAKFTSSGQLAEGETDIKKALDICRQFGDKRGIALAVGSLGLLHHFTGDFEACIREASESAEIAREWGNQFLLCSTYQWLWMGFVGLGEYDEASKALSEASRLASEIGWKHGIAMVPNSDGSVYNELCNFKKALTLNQEGLEVSRRLEDTECEIFSLLNLVGDHIGLEEYDKAKRFLKEVWEKTEHRSYRIREWRYMMHMTKYQSQLSLAEGDYSKALEFAEDTIAQGQKTGSKKYIAVGWKLKGQVLMATDRLNEATECFQKAWKLADQMSYPPLMWKTRYSLGQIYNQQSKYEAAKKSLEKASVIIERMASKVSDTEVKETFLNSNQIQDVYKQLSGL
jgi:tetratricopeptide (TPR) repeat protein